MALKTGGWRLGLALVAAGALAGCSNNKDGGTTAIAPVMLKAAAEVFQGEKAAKAAATPDQVSRADLAKIGGPVMRMKIKAAGIDTFLVRYQQRGEIATWTDRDGATLTFRSGILLETRGLGADLMSSAGPTPGQIAGGGSHRRVYFNNGAEDQNDRRDYTCSATRAGSERIVIQGAAYDTSLVVERCDRAEGWIENRYWLQGGTIRKSREWLSPGFGYAEFERILD